jgi:peroxiredoxin
LLREIRVVQALADSGRILGCEHPATKVVRANLPQVRESQANRQALLSVTPAVHTDVCAAA